MLSTGLSSASDELRAFCRSVARLPLYGNRRLRKNFALSWGSRYEKPLGSACGVRVWRPLGSVVASTLAQADGVAAGPGPISAQKMWLACENGHDYPLHPIGVSRENDLVTGYMLMTGRGHGVHMRLIPMGSGYRYAGRGVWFDGLRGNAVLNWGTPDEVPCKVRQQ